MPPNYSASFDSTTPPARHILILTCFDDIDSLGRRPHDGHGAFAPCPALMRRSSCRYSCTRPIVNELAQVARLDAAMPAVIAGQDHLQPRSKLFDPGDPDPHTPVHPWRHR
jgi:hypothetical protein